MPESILVHGALFYFFLYMACGQCYIIIEETHQKRSKERRYCMTIQFAEEEDTGMILRFIKELADYEGMLTQVEATEELLREWIFEKKSAEVLIGMEGREPVGFALFFHNFSTFLGRAGIYLEDLYVRPEFREKGCGTAFLKCLAEIAVERGCGRLEWWCLDWNKPSIDFYRTMGAVPMDDWTVYRIAGDQLKKLSGRE